MFTICWGGIGVRNRGGGRVFSGSAEIDYEGVEILSEWLTFVSLG